MRKLLLSLALGMPLISCGALSTVIPEPSQTCKVPVLPPAPALDPQVCGERVCLTVEETVELARWGAAVKEVERALALCPEVTRV